MLTYHSLYYQAIAYIRIKQLCINVLPSGFSVRMRIGCIGGSYEFCARVTSPPLHLSPPTHTHPFHYFFPSFNNVSTNPINIVNSNHDNTVTKVIH